MISADAICMEVQKKVLKERPANCFEPWGEKEEKVLEGGVRYSPNFRYGSEWPNSYFDIWRPKEKGIYPTILYFHGGGFLFGDKVGGDPLAKGEDSSAAVLRGLAERGYCIVSADYALAPEYRFPEQCRQMNALLAFLMGHGNEYGLDTGRLVLMGSSAGADMVEIYGALLTAPDYAAALGVSPAIRKEQVNAIVVDEATLNLDYMMDSQNLLWLMGSWLGVEPLDGSREAKLMNAAKYIREGYPPTFIISSNQEHYFYDSGKDLEAVLARLDIPREHYYCPAEEDRLEHGFMNRYQSNPHAAECFGRMVAFLKKYAD
ncbi:MAG: alpha/beta hydrolase [Blautia sp.]|nr:alpha/beta hydrolase [Blautia sp.]